MVIILPLTPSILEGENHAKLLFPNKNPLSVWSEESDSNRRMTVLQTAPLTAWVSSQIVHQDGFKPSTFRVEVCCSIH